MHFSFLLLTAIAGASAVPGSTINTRSPYRVKETHNVPARWRNIGEPASDHRINLQIGLTPSNFEELERHLYEGALTKA